MNGEWREKVQNPDPVRIIVDSDAESIPSERVLGPRYDSTDEYLDDISEKSIHEGENADS